MSVATSLKLPAELKAQIDETARRAQQREQFDQDRADALAEVESNGLAYQSEDLLAYCESRSRGENPTKPDLKPWRGAPSA